MVTILMMPAEMDTPGLRKINIFWKKGYDVAISVNGVTSKTLSRDLNYIVDVVMWPKFGNSSISMREFIINQSLSRFDPKKHLFEEWSWFNFNNLGLTQGTNLKFYTNVAKGLKLKVKKFLGLIPTLIEVKGKKLVVGPFWVPPSLTPILYRVKAAWIYL